MVDSWTTGTAAAAFLLYVVSQVVRFHIPSARQLGAVRLEACSWLLLLMHVGFAFHEHHHWSHVAAEAHVAKETAATLGVHWGGGIYFNHALMLVWGIAILRRWTGRFRREPARLIDRVFDLYTALMWLSATIVFGSLGFRVLGAIGFTAIAWAYWVARGRQTLNAAPHVPQSQR